MNMVGRCQLEAKRLHAHHTSVGADEKHPIAMAEAFFPFASVSVTFDSDKLSLPCKKLKLDPEINTNRAFSVQQRPIK